jgi:hypothetical protein
MAHSERPTVVVDISSAHLSKVVVVYSFQKEERSFFAWSRCNLYSSKNDRADSTADEESLKNEAFNYFKVTNFALLADHQLGILAFSISPWATFGLHFINDNADLKNHDSSSRQGHSIQRGAQ